MALPRIGFVGIGMMGHGMARNLLAKGYPLTFKANRNRANLDDLLAAGAQEAATSADCARAADIVFVCVTGSPQVVSCENDRVADGRISRLFLLPNLLSVHKPRTVRLTKLIDEAVWALGIAVANAQNLLDLEAIVIGGGLGDRLGAPFVRRVSDAMAPQLFAPDRPPQMLTTELGDLGGAVGAAVLAGG